MARRNTPTAKKSTTRSNTTVKITKPEEKTTESNGGMFEKIQYDLQHNQSYLNLILGGLIIVVLGVLVYNYFNKPDTSLPTSPQPTNQDQSTDVSKDNLPGKYTVKAGDTLFTIAQTYYDDGYKYTEIAKENNLSNVNQLEVGQVLTIPSLASASASPTEDTTTSPDQMSPNPSDQPAMSPDQSMNNPVGTTEKGATTDSDNSTIWGDKITTDTYTVQPGDWLSKIASRAYGDVMQYNKIAQANNIQNPDSIEVGTILKLPR